MWRRPFARPFAFARINTFPRQFGFSRPRIRTYAIYKSFQNSSSYGSLDWNTNLRRLAIFAVVSGVIYVANLEPAPYSGRKRFMLVGPNLEKYIGERGYKETMAEFGRYLMPDNHPEVVRVKEVMKRIIAVSGLDGNSTEWRIHVIDNPNFPPNAFVLPGGKVFVFRSILPICANDDGLATVLSHETAHQVARHTAENVSKAPFYFVLGILMYTITGSDFINRLLINGLLQLPASREMETEADYIGLVMMSKACFDPAESVRLWQRMADYEKRRSRTQDMFSTGSSGAVSVPEFLSTHPSSVRRIDFLRDKQQEAQMIREQAGCNDFQRFWAWH